jgi:hypothetical protein
LQASHCFGILRRGLLLPRSAIKEFGVSRTDAGLLGRYGARRTILCPLFVLTVCFLFSSGIYFASNPAVAAQYSSPDSL